MTGTGDLYEDKFARVYAEIVRLDQLRETDSTAEHRLIEEVVHRLDGRMDSQETAVAAALAAAEKAVAAALAASEKGVTKAEAAQGKVNETQNEFRGQLKDQAAMFMPRTETENLIRELRGLIVTQGNVITELRSRIDVGPPSLSTLQTRSDEQVGRRGGSLENRTLAFAAVGAIIGIVGVATAIAAFVVQ